MTGRPKAGRMRGPGQSRLLWCDLQLATSPHRPAFRSIFFVVIKKPVLLSEVCCFFSNTMQPILPRSRTFDNSVLFPFIPVYHHFLFSLVSLSVFLMFQYALGRYTRAIIFETCMLFLIITFRILLLKIISSWRWSKPLCDIEHAAFGNDHVAWSMQHRACSIKHAASSIHHQECGSIKHSASCMRHRAWGIEHASSL